MKKKDKEKELLFYTVPVKPGPKVPFAEERISAGFPSPADNYSQGDLDLNTLLIKNPPATFFVRVNGDSMINAGIYPDDILIVDKSIEAKNRDIVIALLNGEFTVKRLLIKGEKIELFPENKNYNSILIAPESDFEVWGVVTNVIHKAR